MIDNFYDSTEVYVDLSKICIVLEHLLHAVIWV